MMRIIYILVGCILFASCSKNHDSNESANHPSVAITGPTVMYASPGDIYAIDAASGAFRWHFSSNGALARPAYGNGMIYIGTLDTSLTKHRELCLPAAAAIPYML